MALNLLAYASSPNLGEDALLEALMTDYYVTREAWSGSSKALP